MTPCESVKVRLAPGNDMKKSFALEAVTTLVTLNKQLLDEVFVICRIISVEVREYLLPGKGIPLTETLTIWHIANTESIHFKWRNA